MKLVARLTSMAIIIALSGGNVIAATWIADVAHGLVCGMSQFRHPQLERTVKIEALGFVAPYDSKTGWE